jgi:hypothetical protein
LDLKSTAKELSLSLEVIDILQKVSLKLFIMLKLLEKDPSKRLGTKGGAAEIKSHPFFRGTDWNKILRREI